MNKQEFAVKNEIWDRQVERAFGSLLLPIAAKLEEQSIYLLNWLSPVQNPEQRAEAQSWIVEIKHNFDYAMASAPCEPEALLTVAEFASFLDCYYFTCDEDMLHHLAELYSQTAAAEEQATGDFYTFVSDAIYCYIGLCC